MKIGQNAVVEFSYDLEVDGKIVDRATEERPLDYIHGTGSLIPALEAHIEGMEPGSTFDVTISAADGYGEVDPNRIIDLPKSAFEVDGEVREDLLVPGNTIPMLNAMGGVIPGVVVEVTEDSVKMDLNHQMAGKTLHFTGKVLTVREATDKELEEGLHGEFVHSCGCGCHGGNEGGCHGGCEGGCHSGGCEGGCHSGGCEGDCHCGEEGHECHCGEGHEECGCH